MKNVKDDFLQRAINNIHIEILEHGHFFGDKHWNHTNITSPFNRIYFMLAGESYVESGKMKTELLPGHAYLIPAHTTNNYRCDGSMEKFYVHLKIEFFTGYDIFQGIGEHLSIPYEMDGLLKLIHAAPVNRLENAIRLRAILYDAIAGFVGLISSNGENRFEAAGKYNSLHKYIQDNCSAKMTLKGIAEHFSLLESTLNRNYKKDTGITLKSFISSQILQTAKEKLLLSDLNIKEIAYMLKFSDEFYFSRFFKRLTGISPREYRSQNSVRY